MLDRLFLMLRVSGWVGFLNSESSTRLEIARSGAAVPFSLPSTEDVSLLHWDILGSYCRVDYGVLEIREPFWVPKMVRHLYEKDPRRDPDSENYPYGLLQGLRSGKP